MKLDRSTVIGVLLGSVAALVFTATQAAAQTSELREEFHKVYPLAANGRVEVRNLNGWVKVTAWDRNEVKVDAAKYARSKERMDEATIEVNADPEVISINTRYRDHDQTFRDDDYDNPATVDYTLTVPAGASLRDIKLVNGDLDITGVAGEVRASCINGRLTVHGLRGHAELATVNGKLEAAFDRLSPERDIELKSVNGSLVATLPSDANAEVEAKTVSGSIGNDFGLPVQHGRFIGERLLGRLGAGAARVELKNVNGSISLHHAADGKPLSPATNLLRPNRNEMY